MIERVREDILTKISPRYLKAIRIKLADPETIKTWSYAEMKGRERGEYGLGEVKKPETINYRTQKPEPGGLFCERIFGPIKDYECSCGKYKGRKYAGVICDRCHVEVTESRVRRERMGYIELAVPVAHIWFYKIPPSIIGTLLDISRSDLEEVLYYGAYIVINPGKVPGIKKGEVLTMQKYEELVKEYGKDAFEAGMGAEAIKKLLAEFSEPVEGNKTKLEKLLEELTVKLRIEKSTLIRRKILQKLRIVKSFVESGVKPEWMILEVLPVIPPDLRPLVALEGGRFAASDLNDLYKRVIYRNQRLKYILADPSTPELILRNEKRMLQEAVDAVLDNSRRKKPVLGRGNRKLKSLSDDIRGKKGLLRRNLLGKRVDYSARSVIVVGPELKIYQAGVPKEIAVELWRPFIEKKIEELGLAENIRSTRKLLRKRTKEVWEILEDVVKNHPIWLNRAPTLHRPSIQAFEPVIVEGKAIKLHPLVCTAYNADFDGDQMAIFVPLSPEAQLESYNLVLSVHNILSPAHGKPLASASQDMVIGINYLTKIKAGAKGEGKIFYSIEEALKSYENGIIELHSLIKVPISKDEPFSNNPPFEFVETTVGRILFNMILPVEFRKVYGLINKELKKKDISDIVYKCHRLLGAWATAEFLDNMKDLGFKYATKSGVTFGIDDIIIPSNKYEIIEEAFKELDKINKRFERGEISRAEHYQQVLDLWMRTTENVKKELEIALEKDKDGFNPIYMMVYSGARGNIIQTMQLSAMRGLMARPSRKGEIGDLIEIPVISSLKEGLKTMEYFISTHGARKGQSDTALKTADAGYLTRRLVDVAQDVVVTIEDCGTVRGRTIRGPNIANKILGRVALEDIYDPNTNELIVAANEEIDEEKAERIEKSGINEVVVRSVLYCEAEHGVCAKCYGRNLASGKLVDIGEAVGIIAAQSIGEPGTQLTLRTFHTGGVAEKVAEENFYLAPFEGKVEYINLNVIERDSKQIVISKKGKVKIISKDGKEKIYEIPYGSEIFVKDKQKVKMGDKIAEWEPYSLPIMTTKEGYIEFEDLIENVTLKEEVEEGKVERVIQIMRQRKLYPKVKVIDPKTGKVIEEIPLVNEARLTQRAYELYKQSEKEIVKAGEIIARLPKITSKTRDITGGLPKVEELFEARSPKNKAILSEISGYVEMLGLERGEFKIKVTSEDGRSEIYRIPYGRYLLVSDGEFVEAGDPLTDGEIDPHDLLKIKGKDYVQEYLFDRIQSIYKMSDVEINDKHIEIIVRQMLRKVKIVSSGSTNLFEDDIVDYIKVKKENERVMREGGKPATYTHMLLGITKAALSSDSFISAASFQETTKVLAFAAIEGKEDNLYGLKENVIIGGLIPAGTGRRDIREASIIVEEAKKETA
ncbi:MAG: DNA-directed RNA polymerase subunit beta' [candidate division WOR-3 bacterium]